MKEAPYIGITGPTTRQEVGHIINSFDENGIDMESPHVPMIGILVSHKTLNGGEIANNRRYPAFKSIPGLLDAAVPFSFNTIHYSSRKVQDLGDQIIGIFKGPIYEDGLSQAVQLNIAWPPKEELRRAKIALPDLRIIMQLSGTAMKDKSPQEVAVLLADYGTLADYTLIDPSGGQGVPFEASQISPYFEAITEKVPHLRIGVAGGFSGENVADRVGELINILGTDGFSIDAEGALRDKVGTLFGDDIYNPAKAELYITEASKVL